MRFKSRHCFKKIVVLIAVMSIEAAFCLADSKDAVKENLIFSDDFGRTEIGNDWKVLQGKWRINIGAQSDGQLCGAGSPATIVLNRAVGRNLRLEYTAWSEHAGDMSAFLCAIPEVGQEPSSGYFFGFGSYYGVKNDLMRCGTPLVESNGKFLPTTPGRKYRVVVEQLKNKLSMTVDGSNVFSGVDNSKGTPDAAKGQHLGFYVWSDDIFFDDVKVYKFEGLADDEAPEIKPEVSEWFGFEEDAIGAAPKGLESVTGKSSSVSVTNFPNYTYPLGKGDTTIEDKCIELESSSNEIGEGAGITRKFGKLKQGIVEFDLLARKYDGEAARISLLGADGKVVATAGIDDKGEFYYQARPARIALKNSIEYKYRFAPARLYLQPERWFTIRVEFDVLKQDCRVALVELYNGQYYTGVKWFSLGDGLPFLEKTDFVEGVSVSSGSKAILCLDNLCVVGPCGGSVNGKPTFMPIRELMSFKYPQRLDPVALKIFSLRWGPTRAWVGEDKERYLQLEPTPEFRKAGLEYSKLLVRQAFLKERGDQLSRLAFNLAKAKGKNDFDEQTRVLVGKIEATESELDAVYRTYASAYLDHMHKEKLNRYETDAAALSKKIDELDQHTGDLLAKYGKMLEKIIERSESAVLPANDSKVPVWRNGHFEKDGIPTFFFHPHGFASQPDHEEILHLIPCLQLLLHSGNCKDGEYFDCAEFDNGAKSAIGRRAESAIVLSGGIGMADCMSVVPAWWLEKNINDPDILVMDRDGQARKAPGSATAYTKEGNSINARLNHFSPKVLELTRKQFGALAERVRSQGYGDKVPVLRLGGESSPTAYGGETGFNDSAVAAFQSYLKDEYKSIDGLNKAWNTKYKSFADINQRAYSALIPGGLTYEFQRFRQKGYFNWMKAAIDGFKEKLPGIPVATDPNFEISADLPGTFDFNRIFETFDIVAYHTYTPDTRKPMFRLFDSLNKVYHKALGDGEWGAPARCGELFEEEAYKANGLKSMFDGMAWANVFWPIWYGNHVGWAEGSNWDDWRFKIATLRYSSSFIPLAQERTRKLGYVSLANPTIKPKLAILEPTSSFYNMLGVRRDMELIAKELEKDGWNYEFLFEEPLIKGGQTLKGTSTLIVPSGICMRPELSKKLLSWVKKGGTMVALLAPGAYNQYAQPDDRLLKGIFGEDVNWRPKTTLNLSVNKQVGVWAYGSIMGFKDFQVEYRSAELAGGAAATIRRLCVFDGDKSDDVPWEFLNQNGDTLGKLTIKQVCSMAGDAKSAFAGWGVKDNMLTMKAPGTIDAWRDMLPTAEAFSVSATMRPLGSTVAGEKSDYTEYFTGGICLKALPEAGKPCDWSKALVSIARAEMNNYSVSYVDLVVDGKPIGKVEYKFERDKDYTLKITYENATLSVYVNGAMLIKTLAPVVRLDQWKAFGLDENAVIGSYGDDNKIVSGKAGSGKVFILTGKIPFPTAEIMKLVTQNTARDIYCKQKRFDLVARGAKDALYIFVSNPDHYNTLVDEILIEGEYHSAADIGLPVPCPVGISLTDGYTVFSLRLAPAEGTVIKMIK